MACQIVTTKKEKIKYKCEDQLFYPLCRRDSFKRLHYASIHACSCKEIHQIYFPILYKNKTKIFVLGGSVQNKTLDCRFNK
jgi:hypothetical protein